MKVIFPEGAIDVTLTSCFGVLENGGIKLCIVIDHVFTQEEARRIKEAAEREIVEEQVVDSRKIVEKQMFIDQITPLLTP